MHTYSLDSRLPGPRSSRLQAWSGALLFHGGAALALAFAWPQDEGKVSDPVPVQVRLVEAERPHDRPAPPPPVRQLPPPPPVAQPLPVRSEPPPPVPVPPQPVAPVVTEVPAPVVPPPPPVAVAAAPEPLPITPPSLRPPPPEPLVEARFDADYLSNPKPPYPMVSRRLGEAGTVLVRVQVGPEGQPLKVELKTSCGYPRLDQSAMDTVSRWRFVPARRGSVPVVSWVVVPMIFSLT